MIIYPEQWADQGVNYALQWSGDLPPDPPPEPIGETVAFTAIAFTALGEGDG